MTWAKGVVPSNKGKKMVVVDRDPCQEAIKQMFRLVNAELKKKTTLSNNSREPTISIDEVCELTKVLTKLVELKGNVPQQAPITLKQIEAMSEEELNAEITKRGGA